jgi:hypothetical protein
MMSETSSVVRALPRPSWLIRKFWQYTHRIAQFEKKMVPLPRVPLRTGSSQKCSLWRLTVISAELLQWPVFANRSIPHSRGQSVQFDRMFLVSVFIIVIFKSFKYLFPQPSLSRISISGRERGPGCEGINPNISE